MAKVDVTLGRIEVHEPVSRYDDFVRRFLTAMGSIDHVLVSGYTAIVLGRSRETEDIDMLVGIMDRAQFGSVWDALHGAGFWCINAGSPDSAFANLEEHIALRFADEGQIMPNMEFKFAWDQQGRRALETAWTLDLWGVVGRIADLNEQVAYKLYLGSDKDFEDALHVCLAAREVLDWAVVSATAKTLGVSSQLVHLKAVLDDD